VPGWININPATGVPVDEEETNYGT
jgi:hypothetical protein